MSKNKFDFSMVPEHFKRLIEDYGFADNNILEKAVACRSASDWFAILFQDGNDFFAVDFRYYGQAYTTAGIERINGWEIQNDDIGPFDSVDDFLNTKLTQSFF